MPAGPIAPSPFGAAKDGNPVATLSCARVLKLMRVIDPVAPKQRVVPSELGIHGPLPPVPASATYNSPLGEMAIPRGLLRPVAIISAPNMGAGTKTHKLSRPTS